jgi:hypothetical protein
MAITMSEALVLVTDQRKAISHALAVIRDRSDDLSELFEEAAAYAGSNAAEAYEVSKAIERCTQKAINPLSWAEKELLDMQVRIKAMAAAVADYDAQRAEARRKLVV